MKYILNKYLVFFILGVSACDTAGTRRNDEAVHDQADSVYTCPMHPEVEQLGPGICPKCNMKLERKAVFEAINQVLSPNKQVLSRQSTVRLYDTDESQVINAQGYIDIDQTRSRSVSARFGGRIEKLYVKYNLQFVEKGDRIMEIYSPELNTYQLDHLFLLKTAKESVLFDQSRKKLSFLGLTENQIASLEKNGLVNENITIYSSFEGFILFNTQARTPTGLSDSQQPSMDNMDGSNTGVESKYNIKANDQIREGQYINKNETLYTVNDLKSVWGIISVPNELQSQIDVKSEVKIKSELIPGPVPGEIILIEKTFGDSNQRFNRVRAKLPNPNGKLKVNSLFSAEIFPSTGSGLRIPASAVYRTGLNSFVWVRMDSTREGTGIFQLRKVVTGPVTNGKAQVISGLSPDEEIAEHAGYLTDSETFLYEN